MYTELSDGDTDTQMRPLGAAWSQVSAIVSAVDSALGKWVTDNYGIGLTEFRAALHLSRTSDRELRITELAHRVGLNLSSATRLVGRMETKELAFRDTCPDDGRGVYAVITERGLTAVDEIRGPYEERIAELLRDAARQFPQLDLTGLDGSFRTIETLVS